MIRIFFNLVELRTKVASLLPFLIGTTIAYYTLGSISFERFFLMMFSLLCIDMATTGLNHYYDYKRALLKKGYHYEKHNPISSGELAPHVALRILIALIVLGIFLGLGLVLYTDLVVLALGSLSFAVGISYSAGPLPLSRTILGELFSGFFMGVLIPFIAFYIQVPARLLGTVNYEQGSLLMQIHLDVVASLLFVSFSLMLFIGNIMLANNICDMEEDFENKRYTLPLSIGRKNSIILFKINIVMAYLSLFVALITGNLPWFVFISFISMPIVYKNTRKFTLNPVKAITFKYAVKNFLVFSSVLFTNLLMVAFMKFK